MPGLDIITCPQWEARQPKQPITTCGQSKRIIFHHTAGHHAEIENPQDESLEEAMRYARDIQAFQMGPQRGWNDTGQNFLVTRAGQVLQGRWLTVSAIEAGHMVISAHCPHQNDQIGIEHEHKGTEKMTPEQAEASAVLMAWIAWHYKQKVVLPVFPHHRFFATSCPANLEQNISAIVKQANKDLKAEAF